MTVLLVLLAVGFAWSIGAHYTGACMGMPHALGAVTAWRALLLMAPLSLLGATFASHGVERTVGHGLLAGRGLSVPGQLIVLGTAFMMTTFFTQSRIPTSTIQVLVFSLAGTAVGAGAGVRWAAIGRLACVWAAAPLVAAALGYAGTRLLDLIPQVRQATRPGDAAGAGMLGYALVGVGAVASFAMGANDVSNASGSLVGTGTFSPLIAGLVGGAGLALGVLTWGRPLLTKVAFDIVTLDRPMAAAAQLVQGLVVLVAVAFGYFTSMNQALVGAMAGAGAARGLRTVNMASITGIMRGWLLGPAGGFAIGYLVARAVVAAAGAHALLLHGG